jgi:Ca2+-binding RTX toxin-like protein
VTAKRGGVDESYSGGGGNDVVIATIAYIQGDSGNDVLRGGNSLEGGTGNDRLVATGRNGTFFNGGPGNDVLIGNAVPNIFARLPGGPFELGGGPGNDRLVTVNGKPEDGPVDCGAGRDRIQADRADRLRRCEATTRR